MKKITTLLLLLASISFVSAQSSIGLHFGTGLPHSFNPLPILSSKDQFSFSPGIDYRTRIGKQLHFYASLGMLTIGEKYELRWGTQHDGQGNYIPSSPSDLARASVINTDFFLATQAGVKYYLTDKKVSLFIQPYIEIDFLIAYRNSTIEYLVNGSVGSESATTSIHSIDEPLVYTLAGGIGWGLEVDIKKSFSLYVMPDVKLLTTVVKAPSLKQYIIPSVRLGLLYKL